MHFFMTDDPYERQKRHLAGKRDAGWRQVKIDLDPDQIAKLDTACAKENLSRSAFVKRAVLKALHNTNEQE